MSIKLGINGFGRIGRHLLRLALDSKEIEVVAVNDIADIKTCSQLLKYDSVFGILDKSVNFDDDGLDIDGKRVKFFSERSPDNIDWSSQNCQIIVESTGIFTSQEQASMHLDGTVQKVIISAPSNGPVDFTTVMGANDDLYDSSEHHIISNASCTTNCLAIITKVLRDNFGLDSGHMTTIHSYTNDQRIIDSPHKDLRRARAGALSMIPTSTGATKAIEEIFPELKGNLSAISIRVPTPNVSIIDFVAKLSTKVSLDELNHAFVNSSQGSLRDYLDIAPEGAVSIDLLRNKHSAVFDPFGSRVIGDDFIKVIAWYDNEYGYSSRVLDLASKIGKLL
jgi:glyceraldehyde 3-phosphate dehydrogenase|tara:strand:- start:28061 stop:29068 length:1008 start_codon:yes stop_codon:yes gene_type:complete